MQNSSQHGEIRADGESTLETIPDRSEDLQADAIRVDTYTLLAALFRQPPSNDLLQSLAAVEPPVAQPLRPTNLERAWQSIAGAAKAAWAEQVEDEFNKLFVGISGGELTPYGSWYIGGAVMGKPLAALRDDLARFGLQRAEGNTEPEDHAAAICETMALLADPEQGLPLVDQHDFFSAHVGLWLPRFFQDLQKAKNANFYVSVGALGEAFIEFEKVWLKLPE